VYDAAMAHGLVIRNGQVIDGTGRPCFLNRGGLRTGAFADRNRIDLDDAGLPVPAFVHDFPHGAGCFRQGASFTMRRSSTAASSWTTVATPVSSPDKRCAAVAETARVAVLLSPRGDAPHWRVLR